MKTIPVNARYTVLGSGSWATAIIKLISGNATNVGWYVREQSAADYILQHRRNPKFLSSVEFDVSKITLYTSVNEAIANSDVLIVVIPSAFVEVWMKDLKESTAGKFFVSAVKGIIPQRNQTVLEYLQSEWNVGCDKTGFITGPCHAEEIALERLSYLTFAFPDEDNAKMTAQQFAAPFVRTVTSTDVYGTEYASILKNIYAIAAGICHGIGYGDNFQAVLISNAHIELSSFLQQVFPSRRNVDYSAYLGDLLVTCYSQFSRNRTFGSMIGKGYRVRDAQLEMNMVAEGYYAAQCMHNLNQKYRAALPIAECMYRILYQDSDARQEILQLIKNLY